MLLQMLALVVRIQIIFIKKYLKRNMIFEDVIFCLQGQYGALLRRIWKTKLFVPQKNKEILFLLKKEI